MKPRADALLAVSPDGRVLVSLSGPPGGEQLGTPLSFLPNKEAVATGTLRESSVALEPPPGAVSARSVSLAVVELAAPIAVEGYAWTTPNELVAAYRSGESQLTGWDLALLFKALGLSGTAPAFAFGHARRFELTPTVAVLPLRTPTLPPATHTNCVFLRNPDDGSFVAIDPAPPYDDERSLLVDAVGQEQGRLVAVWLTHHHPDHVQAAALLADRFSVPICAHRETSRLLAGSLSIDRELGAGELLAVGSGAAWVRALFTPGHAPGHLCFFEERTRTLVAGDMVAGVGTIVIDPPLGRMAEYLDSLAELRRLDARRLVPAHGPATLHVDRKLADYIAHRLDRERRVRAALDAVDAPATPIELVPAAYPDVSPMLYPLAARSLLAHLHKLVAEGLVVEKSPGRYRAAD